MPDHFNNPRHYHQDFSLENTQGEKRTFYVLILTAVTMVVEIVAGTIYGSMALLADGWHMGTHVAAFMITLFAYRFALKHKDNPAYAFGTGKVNVLGGFASVVALSVVSLVMLIESIQRIVQPENIQFDEAILIATLGLIINLISAVLLKDHHHHHHGDHDHDHDHDHNLRAAYMHVLVDALTSLLAIMALFAGKYFGWHWMDPMMGIVGAIIITRWAYGLVKQSGPILLDSSIDKKYRNAIANSIQENDQVQLLDLHIWRVSSSHFAAILAIETTNPKSPDFYKAKVTAVAPISHVTIEVNLSKHRE